MLAKFQNYRPDGLIEGLGLKTLFAFFSAKAMRGGPRLLPQIAICVVILIALTKLLPTKFSDIAFGSGYTRILKWRPTSSYDDGSVGGGIRIVSFGGGDITSPNKRQDEAGVTDKSWTEVLCEQLDHCNAHLSHTPQTDAHGGAIISNDVYGQTLDVITAWPNVTQGSGYDYTWMTEQYPVPTHLPDLEQQITAFLATPPPRNAPRETLWVFSFGYWEVWKLASMPREIATELLERQAEQLFLQIERLYSQAREDTSIAYSDYYTMANITAPESATEQPVLLDVPAEPFRVFIPSLFDISLTPGFETNRPTPPHPHNKAKEMGNAAYLTQQWETIMNDWIDSWIAIPDPVVNETTQETALVKRNDATGRTVYVPNARREAITQDTPKYIKEMIVDRQLHDSELVDHNGLGAKPIEDGFLEVWEPCMPVNMKANTTSITKEKQLAGSQSSQTATGICSLPNEHLFWTEFTLGQRAIAEIGKNAANRFRMHVAKGANWLKKSQETELTPREFIG